MSFLWMTIDPDEDETRLMLTEARVGSALRARLPPVPRQPQALAQLLGAISAWYGMPLSAVVDAGAQCAWHHHPERWAQFLGEIDGESVRVEWVVVPAGRQRDRFLSDMGDFSSAKRLVTFAATGQK